MTLLPLIILKLWLAFGCIALVWCVCRWRHIDGAVIPGAAILILCGAVRYAL
ncbi:hypothetical protein [Methylobacterium sp. 1973]|uniref:hypothetical protein n=1 Tax=Methylobacterium sp. 1973 TaxID=3156421 RepID=UPI003392BEA7